MSREQKEPLRFSITWRDGMYRVSVPNIVGVEVVEAAAYDALRTQLAATEQARDIATKREEHFHTVNVELVEKLTEVKRERNVAYDARRNADIYARRYEEQAESAAQERDAARAQLTDANQEITELRTVIQELVGVMESAPEDFVPQYRHFVVAPDGIVCVHYIMENIRLRCLTRRGMSQRGRTRVLRDMWLRKNISINFVRTHHRDSL